MNPNMERAFKRIETALLDCPAYRNHDMHRPHLRRRIADFLLDKDILEALSYSLGKGNGMVTQLFLPPGRCKLVLSETVYPRANY